MQRDRMESKNLEAEHSSNLRNAATYAQMAEAIAFMRQHQHQQPDLATIAAHIHLSPAHFQRRFTRWAGVSPKRFMQFLTVERAKTRISASSLLDLSASVGLSGPGRLHDLFVNLEAMSPGEYRQQGKDLRIEYEISDSPFGPVLIAQTRRGICELQFLDPVSEPAHSDLWTLAEAQLNRQWPRAIVAQKTRSSDAIADHLFGSERVLCPPLTLHLKGTNFQIQVWRALLKIPLGEVATYGQLANAIGKPTAARAVGNAIGKNPVAYLIPCHRVIRESGSFGGYRWGGDRKAALLGWEAAQLEKPQLFVTRTQEQETSDEVE